MDHTTWRSSNSTAHIWVSLFTLLFLILIYFIPFLYGNKLFFAFFNTHLTLIYFLRWLYLMYSSTAGNTKRKKQDLSMLRAFLCHVILVPFYLTCSFDFFFHSSPLIHSTTPFFSCPKVHCFRSPLSPKKRVIWESHVSWCFMFYHYPFSFCLPHTRVSLIFDWASTFVAGFVF